MTRRNEGRITRIVPALNGGSNEWRHVRACRSIYATLVSLSTIATDQNHSGNAILAQVFARRPTPISRRPWVDQRVETVNNGTGGKTPKIIRNEPHEGVPRYQQAMQKAMPQ